MQMIRVGLHSMVLVMADIAGIAGGALAAFHILGVANQVALQLPIAVLLSVGCFWVWIFSFHVLRLRSLQLASSKDLGTCLVLSFLWAPVVFVPLHYFTQGYLTSIGNLVALAVYQLPVNGLALFGSRLLQQSNPERSPQAVQRTGASRFAQRRTKRQARLAPVGDLYVPRARGGSQTQDEFTLRPQVGGQESGPRRRPGSVLTIDTKGSGIAIPCILAWSCLLPLALKPPAPS